MSNLIPTTRAKLLHSNMLKSKVEGYRDGTHALYAWGVTDYIADEDEDSRRNNNYSLRFSVQTKTFIGSVKVIAQAYNKFDVLFEKLDHKNGGKTLFKQLDKVPLIDLMQEVDKVLEPYTEDEIQHKYFYSDQENNNKKFINLNIKDNEFKPIKWIEKFNELLSMHNNQLGTWLEDFLTNVYMAGVDKSKNTRVKSVRTLENRRGRSKKKINKNQIKKKKKIIFINDI